MDFWKKWNDEKVDALNEVQKKRLPRWCIGAAVGVCCLAIGLWNDQFADMYRKAVMICLECIGIG